MSSESQILNVTREHSSEERRKILFDWNQTTAACDTDRCVHWLFEARAASSPLAVAINDGRCTVSYGELNERANRLAHYLIGKGVGRGGLVGVCMDRSVNVIVALLGILKCGAAYVPIEPGWPDERVRFIARTLKLVGMIVDPDLVERSLGFDAGMEIVCIGEQRIGGVERGAVLSISWRDDLPKTNVPRMTGADDRAYIIFTSGSSGDPKGVVLRHRPVINLIDWVNRTFGVGAGDKILFTTSVAFDLSVYDVFGILAAGATIRIASSAELGNPEHVAAILCQEKITIWDSAPAAMERICPFWPATAGGESLRLVLLSGDWIPVGLAAVIKARFGRARIIALGGATEATVWSNYHEIKVIDPAWMSIPYGRPIQNARYYILDSDLEPCAAGTVGELYIGGACLAEGYANDPELTERKFIADPFVPGERMYRTGDRARYFSDGKIEFLGRMDRQVKIRGYRVEPAEIEEVLWRHPSVSRAVVVAEGELASAKRLVAYAVLVDGSKGDTTNAELREYVRRRLPGFMVPAQIEIVSAFPLTSSGKIDRAGLGSLKVSSPRVLNEAGIAPRNETERVLAGVWCKVLGLDRVGIDENFVELGGDSLQSVQIVVAAAGRGLHLRVNDLLERPTIRELALRVVGMERCCVMSARTERVSLTPTQRWFFERPLRYPERYNAVFAFDVLSTISADQLRNAWTAIVRHHDGLRLQFRRVNGVWNQRCAPETSQQDVLVWDLSDVREPARSAEIEGRVASLRKGFDLKNGPLAKVVLLVGAVERGTQILLALHHLVFDAISLGVLVEDLSSGIEQVQQDGSVRRVECGSFAAWANGLSIHAASASLSDERDYWLGLPRGQVKPLPRDVCGGENRYESSRTIEARLSKLQTDVLLRELPRRLGTSVGEILLAACLWVLSRWAGIRTVLIDLTDHGRHDTFGAGATSRMVGYVTTIIPIVVAVRPETSLVQLAREVRDHLRRMPNHGLGYGMLRYLSPDDGVAARLRGCPQSEVKFNYLGSMTTLGVTSRLLRPVKNTYAGVLDPQDQRAYLHNLELVIIEEKLQVEWKYSGAIHRAEAIESLLGQFMSAIGSMVTEAKRGDELADAAVVSGGSR